MPENEVRRPEPIGPEVYWSIVAAWILLLSVLACVAYLLTEPWHSWLSTNLGFSWSLFYVIVYVIAVGLYIGSGIKSNTPRPNHYGIKLLLGSRIVEVMDNGPAHVLWPLFSLAILPKSTIQNQYPAEDKEIDWERKPTDPPTDGKVAPIRVTTVAGNRAGLEPLDRRMTISLSISVTFRIIDPVQFILVMGDVGSVDEKGSGLANARQQIEDTAVSAISSIVGNRTSAWVISNIREINLTLEKVIQYLVQGELPKVAPDGSITGTEHKSSAWGVEVVSANMVRYDLPLTINEEMRSVAAAQFKKEATESTAEALKIQLTKEGEGKAAAREALERAALVGFANGFRLALAKAERADIGLTPQQLAAVQTADKIAQSDNKTIVLGEQVITSLPRQIADALNRT